MNYDYDTYLPILYYGFFNPFAIESLQMFGIVLYDSISLHWTVVRRYLRISRF